MYFANSNIDTLGEYEKRLTEARKVAAAEGVEIFAEPYNHDEWLKEVAAGYENEPEKGARCERCFRYNLKKTAEFAREHGYERFTTSLTISPHKVSEQVFAAGFAAGENFLPENFKKHEGFKRSLLRSKELKLYRQSYCGCEFSKVHS